MCLTKRKQNFINKFFFLLTSTEHGMLMWLFMIWVLRGGELCTLSNFQRSNTKVKYCTYYITISFEMCLLWWINKTRSGRQTFIVGQGSMAYFGHNPLSFALANKWLGRISKLNVAPKWHHTISWVQNPSNTWFNPPPPEFFLFVFSHLAKDMSV